MGLRDVGKCWKKQDKNGNMYLSARINKTITEDSIIFIFKTQDKPYETSADYNIYEKDDV